MEIEQCRRTLPKPKHCLPARFFMVQRMPNRPLVTFAVPGYPGRMALAFESADDAAVVAKIAAASHGTPDRGSNQEVREFEIAEALAFLREHEFEGVLYVAAGPLDQGGHIATDLATLEDMLP